ncbi:MAG TPA: tetratricopeptide repeat protein [Candidatus Omnitrophica bacterium]|nr:tetratricopeptide repeat protein [Candidatus Omnitrophota bacterium]
MRSLFRIVSQEERVKTKGKEVVAVTEVRSTFLSIGLIVLLGFVVYSNSINGEFIWDDHILIKENNYIKDPSNLYRIFTEDIGSGSGRRYGYYRPLYILTFAMNYSLGGLNVQSYHLTNIVLHILVALCVYWLVTTIFGDRLLSLLTGILFVVHPVSTEVVTYISGRDNSLVALFMLLCFVSYILLLHVERRSLYTVMIVSCILALLSRENALILLPLLLAYHYTFSRKVKIKALAVIGGILSVYILGVMSLLSSSILKSGLLDTSWFSTVFQRIPGFFVAITNYSKLMLLPFDLHVEYGDRLFNFSDLKAILGAIILCSSIFYALRKRSSNKLVSFSVFWFFIAILPSSNIYPINNYMAERYLYLPSIGFFLILAKLLSFIYREKKLRAFGMILIVFLSVFYSSLTIKQNGYWREPVSLYRRTLKYTPDSTRAYNNLGSAYAEMGRYEEAIAAYEKLLEISPNDPRAYYNLGNVYTELGKFEKAIISYKRAKELNSDFAGVYYGLGNVYKIMGKNREAIDSYRKSIEINPTYAEAHNNLAIVYYYEGEYDLAVKHCYRAIELGYKVHPGFLELLKPYRKQEKLRL